jgi:hypothetical protein
MTLQEKIDMLPLSIIYNGRKYKLAIVATEDIVRLTYRCGQPIYNARLMNVEDITDRPLSVRIEYVVDRALKVIENKEWEK